jgi:serine/threonine protein kinase
MARERQNCWEYMKCGRQSGGGKVPELGICPAATDASYDGINFGKNAGRFCWAVAGTLCDEQVQGTFAEKRISCISCDFFKLVQQEEGASTSPTKFLSIFSENEKSSFFKMMTYKHIKAGERFITQGQAGDVAYIIQRGSCLIIIEKNGKFYPAGHRGVGDIVGEMALLTGEPRSAHVEAQTDLEVWVLNKTMFDNISNEDPELMNFLTEIVTDRFESSKLTAERKIGKYIITDIIGHGGFSIIYKGVHASLNMPVAIKMLKHDLALRPEFLSRFCNEAKFIAKFNHKNIVKVYDIEERFRTIFIIMEYLEGMSLKYLINNMPRIPFQDILSILIQICSGLIYAHERGIVHLDIKPGNIMILPDDEVKIVDFGLACPCGSEIVDFMGTPFYQAPEQIDCMALDERTDIYSLGITTYEMVTGKRPYPEDNIGKVWNMHLNQDIPDPAQLVPDLPAELRDFIIKACRRDPAKRYQNVAEALEELQPLVIEFGLANKDLSMEKRKMASLFLIYKDEHQLALTELMDDFSTKVQNLGIVIKAADFRDL